MEKNKSNKNIFKLGGSYLGLFVGFIASIQIKISRLLVTEGVTEADCAFKPISSISCPNLALTIILVFCLLGFLIGGLIHKRTLEKE